MKKTLLFLLPMALLTACGGGDIEAVEDGLGDPPPETEILTPETEFGALPDLSTTSADEAIPYEYLVNATMFLEKKEIILVGYPYAYSADTLIQLKEGYNEMLDAEDNSQDEFSVRFKLKEGAETPALPKGELFAVRGKVSLSYSPSSSFQQLNLQLWDAEVVEVAAPTTVTDLVSYDREQAAELRPFMKMLEAYYAPYANKELTVTGRYHSTQSSTVSSGTYHVVVVGTGSDTPVRCTMANEPDNDQLNNMRTTGTDLQIKGTLTEVSSNPRMENCVLVNQ